MFKVLGLKPNTAPSKVPYISDLLTEKSNCSWQSQKLGSTITKMLKYESMGTKYFVVIVNASEENPEEDLVVELRAMSGMILPLWKSLLTFQMVS